MATTEKLLSSCCKAPLMVAGERSTHWYVCTACQQPADTAPLDNAAALLVTTTKT
jgi:hypothetical protein